MAITNQLATYKIYTTIGADTGWFPIYFATGASQVAVVASGGAGYYASRQFVTGELLDKLNLTVNGAGAFATINQVETSTEVTRNIIPESNIPHRYIYPVYFGDTNKSVKVTKDGLLLPKASSIGAYQDVVGETDFFGAMFDDNRILTFHNIANLKWAGSPVDNQSLTNKAYVDMVAGYGVNPLVPVRVTTTGNITLSGTQTIDSVVLAVGNRVLVKNQTNAAQNGIYLVASGAWTRPADADVAGELTGALVVVEEGSSKGFTYYQRNIINTVGTDNQDWILFNNVVSFYSADNASLELVGSQFRIKDGGVTEGKIGSGAIVDSKVAAGAAIQITKLGTTIPSDSATLPQDNNARGIGAYLNQLATLLKTATGNAHWYVPVDSGRALINKQNIPIVSATQPSNPVAGDVWIHI